MELNEKEINAITIAINYYINKHGGLNCLYYNDIARILKNIQKRLESRSL